MLCSNKEELRIKDEQKKLFTYESKEEDKRNIEVHIIAEYHFHPLRLYAGFNKLLMGIASNLKKLSQKSKTDYEEYEEKNEFKKYEEYADAYLKTADYLEKWEARIIDEIVEKNKDKAKRYIFILEGKEENKELFIDVLKSYGIYEKLKNKEVYYYLLDNKISRDIFLYIQINANKKEKWKDVYELLLMREKQWKSFIENELEFKEKDVVMLVVGVWHVGIYLNADEIERNSFNKIAEKATGKSFNELKITIPSPYGGYFIKGFKKHLKPGEYITLYLPNGEIKKICYEDL
ncbi:MAG: hypothetical protein QXL82_02090 [Candidatus Aenigmatarchaeota archaeon]